ncbi:hypothetical protein OIU84_003179 [Salix udensis]|uniref:Protein kinase domain-containing protein n=1 Tax=Salix udensis TaxID=889485 RepID=A0AAD6K686_9ROSI|nr:hypothetical protein OIU84_003179 [Salix udensis]
MTCFSFLFGRRIDSSRQFGVVDGDVPNVKCYSYKELKEIAAIKVLSTESRQGVPEFLAEIKTMSEIEHENLVKLYGCCVEGNHRILVYNYLENNSLAQTLLGGGHINIQFSWRTRTRIWLIPDHMTHVSTRVAGTL